MSVWNGEKKKKSLHSVKVLQKACAVKCWFWRKHHFNVFPKYIK